MTERKRTPLQEYCTARKKLRAAREKAEAEFANKGLDAIERTLDDRDKVIRANGDGRPLQRPQHCVEPLVLVAGLDGIAPQVTEAPFSQPV
jgi:hypothetical protein